MSDAIDQLQSRLSYTFRDPALLTRALTHPSYLPEHPEIAESNQRLEFLGDAVLQLILTEALYQLYPADREGLLSRRRAVLTRGSFLAALALDLGLDACLRLGTSENTTGGRSRASTLEDTFEALVGALYLDGGFANTQRVILERYGPLASRLASSEDIENPKGRLQELVQPVHGNNALRYDVVATAGEDHARSYEVEVYLLDRALGRGRGPSKKSAEEAAARMAVEKLRSEAGA